MSLTTGQKIVRRKFTEMPMTESVVRQVTKWAGKDHALTGLTFMNRYGVEYDVDEEQENAAMLAREDEMAPFPDMPGEAPGMLTQYENILSGENVKTLFVFFLGIDEGNITQTPQK